MLDAFAVIVGLLLGLKALYHYFKGIEDPRDVRMKYSPGPKPKAPPTMPKCKPPKRQFHEVYAMVGCPKCGHIHQYGLDRPSLDCYQCTHTFDPALEGRRYESYKKEKQL